MNSTYVTLCGLVATDPRHAVRNGLPVTSFRLVATSRRFDRESNAWVDGDSTWVTVTCFRGLAVNAGRSLTKRDRVIVHGRLATREWSDGSRRINVEVDADGIGHDLTFGNSTFTRTARSGQVEERQERGVEPDDAEDEATDDRDAPVDDPGVEVLDLSSPEREDVLATPPF